MDNKIIDGMKKEGKSFRAVMIFGYAFAILMPLANYLLWNERYSDNDILSICLIYFMLGTIGLYGWLYAVKYSLEFDDKKVYLKTLFKTIELNICDVEKYSCNQYGKSAFYQFDLFIKGKKVLINTRYKDEFEKILKDKRIEQMIKQ